MIENYRRWYEYERSSHAKVLESFQTVPENRRKEPAYARAVSIFAHMLICRQLWLHRFGIEPEKPTEMFPTVPLDRLTAWSAEIELKWSAHIDTLDDAALSQSFDYASMEGDRFRNTIGEILTQLFGHSWYHRGQIAMLVRDCGGTPAVTDFVYYSREAI